MFLKIVRTRSFAREDTQVSGHLSAVMNLVLVDAKKRDRHFAPYLKAFVYSFFIPALDRKSGGVPQCVFVHKRKLPHFAVQRAYLAQDRLQSERDTLFEIAPIAI